jgi:hypothetical protein
MHTPLMKKSEVIFTSRVFEVRRATMGLISTFAVLCAATLADAQSNLSAANIPHALFCEKEGIIVIGYLARINSDGSAVYMSPSNIVVEVSPEGVVDNRADGSCAGKSLAELRENGQVRDFAAGTK